MKKVTPDISLHSQYINIAIGKRRAGTEGEAFGYHHNQGELIVKVVLEDGMQVVVFTAQCISTELPDCVSGLVV